MKKEKLLVVGNGMAGARLVEEVIARGGNDRFDITIFGEERYGNYNRILLSSVLAGTHVPADIFLNPIAWYEDAGVELRAGARVAGIDRDRRCVTTEDGASESYDKLVLATGSSAFVPPIDGMDRDGARKEGVYVFRTLDDCDAMIEHARHAKKAVVIGGGLLGLEAARGLIARGVDVSVVHLMKHLMEVQLDRAGGAMLKRALGRLGFSVHLEKATVRVRGHERVEGVAFADGDALDCDMLVVCAGIRPNAALARAAGLEVRRGVVVGDDLASPDDPNVFAIGECSEHRGEVYGLVAPAWEQARVLADRLTGARPSATYRGSKLSTKLKVAGVELAVMGEREPRSDDDEVLTYVDPDRGIYKKLLARRGKLVGAILIGDASTAPALLQAFDRDLGLPENRSELLFPQPGERAIDPSDLPDDAQICNCNGVTKQQIVHAVKGGKRSLKLVCDATRAGTGCGACKPQVQAVLELASEGLAFEDPSVHYYVPGVPLTKPELIAAVKEKQLRGVSAVFRELGGGKDDPASKMGLASLLKTIWGKDYDDERDARFINDRVHANIQNDGTFSVVPRIYGGVTDAAELRRIADVAERYGAKMIKITGGQRIDLLGIEKADLPAVWRDLGMPSGHAYTRAFRTCKTCVGTEFCRYGVGDAIDLGRKIERRFQGIESPGKLKLATAGCPRNCSEATVKDVGAVAIEGGKWEIYVGGAAGARVRKGDLLATASSHDEALVLMGRFMQYYRENAKYQERTYDFMERLSVEKVRQVVVEDAEGLASALDAAMQTAVDAYVDPWGEAKNPVHPTQFAATLVPRADDSGPLPIAGAALRKVG